MCTPKVTQWCEDHPLLQSTHINLLLLTPFGEPGGLSSCFPALEFLSLPDLTSAPEAQLHHLAGQLLILKEQ